MIVYTRLGPRTSWKRYSMRGTYRPESEAATDSTVYNRPDLVELRNREAEERHAQAADLSIEKVFNLTWTDRQEPEVEERSDEQDMSLEEVFEMTVTDKAEDVPSPRIPDILSQRGRRPAAEIAEQLRHHNVCAAISIADTTGRPYLDAVDALDKALRDMNLDGYEPGRARTPWPRGANYWNCWSAIRKAVEMLGFEMVETPRPKGVKTTITAGRYLPTDRNYIIESRGHATPVVRGKVQDWSATARKRVSRLFEIVPA